jgi:GT2 family glycosyltransferase
MTPLVSILIPAFNAQQWIAETLESAVGQTWSRKEIILVDDGSTDRTLEIARQFERRGVSIVSQPNQGAAAARNSALAASHGDYLQWLDADDLLAPDKIERQVEAIAAIAARDPGRASRLLLSSAWGRFMYRSDRAEFTPTALWNDLSPAEWLRLKMGYNLYMQTATWLVSRELTESAGRWDTRLLGDDDGEYFCRVLLQSDGVQFVPDAKVFYRMAGADSLSNIGQSDRKMEAHFQSMKSHIAYMRSLEDSERVRAACVTYLQTSLIHVYPERPDIVRQAEEMAAELGGHLEVPRLSWKYSLIGALLGLRRAKRIQGFLSHTRWSVTRLWDKALFQFAKARKSESAA